MSHGITAARHASGADARETARATRDEGVDDEARIVEFADCYSLPHLKDGPIAGGVEKDGPIAGGVERNWTVGVNWYPDQKIRPMANDIRAEADGSPVFGCTEIEADIAESRLQLYW